MIKEIKCFLGHHKWMTKVKEEIKEKSGVLALRKCTHCGELQMLTFVSSTNTKWIKQNPF